MDSRNFQVPNSLDAMPRLFLWDFDVAMVFLCGLGIGIALGQLLFFSLIGLAGAAAFSRVRSGRHPGFLVHSLYWHMPGRMGFRRLPASCEREFIG
jgi:conjugal transfer pilus assembly protein TraL